MRIVDKNGFESSWGSGIFFGLICNCLNFNYHCDDHIFIWKNNNKILNLTDSRQFTISAPNKRVRQLLNHANKK